MKSNTFTVDTSSISKEAVSNLIAESSNKFSVQIAQNPDSLSYVVHDSNDVELVKSWVTNVVLSLTFKLSPEIIPLTSFKEQNKAAIPLDKQESTSSLPQLFK